MGYRIAEKPIQKPPLVISYFGILAKSSLYLFSHETFCAYAILKIQKIGNALCSRFKTNKSALEEIVYDPSYLNRRIGACA